MLKGTDRDMHHVSYTWWLSILGFSRNSLCLEKCFAWSPVAAKKLAVRTMDNSWCPRSLTIKLSEKKMWDGYLKIPHGLSVKETDQKFLLAWATHFLEAEQIFSSAREHHGRIQIRTCLLEWGRSNAHCFFWIVECNRQSMAFHRYQG